MTLWNLGGLNADHIYGVPHIPAPGETLDGTSHDIFLGGKGANMSVAAARAGAHVRHIGAVGPDGGWIVERLMEYGVDTRAITSVDAATAHAIIYVAEDGENSIMVYPGANRAIPFDHVKQSLTQAETGDWFVAQNEVEDQVQAMKLARDMGLRTAYAAAPFNAKITRALLPHLDFLILNEVEARQLKDATGDDPQSLGVADVIVTLGPKGARWFGSAGTVDIASHDVEAVDTTGAGDTFTGYTLAGLDRGQPLEQALKTAAKAAAIMVTRRGTADAIPDLLDVQNFG